MNTANIESIVEEFETRMAQEGVSIVVVTVSERHTGSWVGCRPGASEAENVICSLMALKLQEGMEHVADKREPSMLS